MKTFYSGNPELLEILYDNGISMVCAEDRTIQISDEDAERIPALVAELAPAASGDYVIEDNDSEDRYSIIDR